MATNLTEAEELLIRVCKYFGLTADEYAVIWALLQDDMDKALFGMRIEEGMTFNDLLGLAMKIRRGEITVPPEE